MTRAANVPKELNRLRNEANQFAAETLRPAALALDRMNDPKQVIAPASPLWQALKGACSLRYHAAERPRHRDCPYSRPIMPLQNRKGSVPATRHITGTTASAAAIAQSRGAIGAI